MKSSRLAGLAALAATLAVPAAASAHPSVYESVAKVVDDPGPPVTVKDETRYLVTNHGYSFLYQETNNEADNGVVSYALVPGAYRNQPGFTKTRLLAEGNTGAQVHATCQGVAALWDEAAILGWQGSDPFYNYIPFQRTGVGLDDDPADWIDDVEVLTGVDLNTVTDLAAACAGIGGTLLPADNRMSTDLSSGAVTHATEPLLDEIDGLKKSVAAAMAAGSAADASAKTATARALAAETKLAAAEKALAAEKTAFTVRLADARQRGRQVANRGATVELTGPPSREATVRLRIASARAKVLRLRSAVLGRGTVTTAADGTGSLTIEVSGRAERALKRLKRALKITASAVAGDRADSARGTLTR